MSSLQTEFMEPAAPGDLLSLFEVRWVGWRQPALRKASSSGEFGLGYEIYPRGYVNPGGCLSQALLMETDAGQWVRDTQVNERHPGRSACAKGGTCVKPHVDTFSAQFVQTCTLDQQNWNWLATFYKQSWIGSADLLKGNLMGPRCLYMCDGPFFPATERCLRGTQSLLWATCAATLKWYALLCCN